MSTAVIQSCKKSQKIATSGNRTRASRVAGENSTTEPTLLEVEQKWIFSLNHPQRVQKQDELIKN